MARKLVLNGPAAEAVERLARSAGMSPAELIKRALRREDEAQRSEAESRVNRDTGVLPESSKSIPGQEETFHEREHERIYPMEGRSEALLAFVRDHGTLPESYSFIPFSYESTASGGTPPPDRAIEIPVPAGTLEFSIKPSEDGRSIRISFPGPGNHPQEAGETETPAPVFGLGKPGERG